MKSFHDGSVKEEPLKIGDKVIAKMPYGYAPVIGRIVDIWVNQYGIMMADVKYAENRHVFNSIKSLKRV